MAEKENTPIKCVGRQRSKPKQFRFCVVCSKDLLVFRKYCTLPKDGVGDKLCNILQRTQDDVKSVSNHICYNCKLEVGQVSSLKNVQDEIRTSFDAAEASTAPEIQRVKRMSSSPSKPRKKTTARSQLLSEFTRSQVKLVITKERGFDEVPVSQKRVALVRVAATADPRELAHTIWGDSSLTPLLKECFLEELTSQCASLHSDTSAFGSNQKAIEDWSYLKQEEELLAKAPSLLAVLQAAGHNKLGPRTYEHILPGLMSSAGILLSCRNRKLSAVQTMTALLIKRSGAGSKAFERLNHRFLSLSYPACLSWQMRLGENFDSEVLEWKDQVEADCSGETIPERDASGTHPGYRLVGDNVDLLVKPRQTSIGHASTDLHYFNLMAVKNRVPVNHLSSTRDASRLEEPVDWSEVLPSMDDHHSLVGHWTVLIGHVICTYMPTMQWMRPYLPEHIPHVYSDVARRKSEVVNLGVITENENTNDGMAAIMTHMQKYTPVVDGEPVPIISGGDLLTCEREMNAKGDRQDSTDPIQGWKGVIPVIEDFHTMANFYEVIWHYLYSSNSSRDHGTLFAARNFLNARGVSNQPMKNINAATELLDNYTDALVIAASMEFFGMSSVDETPTRHTFDMLTMDPSCYVREVLGRLVETFAVHEGPELGRVVPIKCPTCGKEYRKAATLRKHIRDKHPLQAPPPQHEQSGSEDYIFNYSCSALSLCLMLRNFTDARKHGDGERLTMMLKFFLLHFKAAGKTKYSFHVLRHLVQLKFILSPRLAHEMTWNRFVNNQGEADTNIEQDREMEHHNRIFKEECRHFRGKVSTASIDRVSHAAMPLERILHRCDKESQVKSHRSRHTRKDKSQDVVKLAANLHSNQVILCKPPRNHYAFPACPINPLVHLNLVDFQEWMRDKVKEMIRRDV